MKALINSPRGCKVQVLKRYVTIGLHKENLNYCTVKK